MVGCEVLSGERAGHVCLGHALSRHGRWQRPSSTAPLGLPPTKLLAAINNLTNQYLLAQKGLYGLEKGMPTRNVIPRC